MDLERILEPIRRRIRLIVGRAVITAVKAASGKNGVTVNITLLGDEKHSDVELFQQYGFCSLPPKGSELVCVFAGGARDNGVAVASQGETSSMPSLVEGEVALFSKFGQKFVMKADGSIEATPKSGGDFVVLGELKVKGNVTAGYDNPAMLVSLQNHMHATAVPGPAVKPTPGM